MIMILRARHIHSKKRYECHEKDEMVDDFIYYLQKLTGYEKFLQANSYIAQMINAAEAYKKSKIELSNITIIPETGTFRSFKEKYREALKGKRIKILDGECAEKEAVFKSWSGTTVFVQFPGNEKFKQIRIDRSIKVYW